MEYIVTNEDVGKRLDLYLNCNLEDITRSYIKTMIENGNIKVNGKSVKAGYSLKLNDNIMVDIPQPRESDIVAQKIDIDILYEDLDIIIVNKEKGMVVHPANGNYEGTLVNSLMESHKNNLSTINGTIRPGIVHRIDKDTSGVLVVAKNDKAHKMLSEQFKVHSITRKYIALVKGVIKEESLDIDLPIGRSTKDRKKMAVVYKNCRNAITHIKVLKRYYNSNVTLVEATLETGRTHQIRVHMSHIGHPLVGDLVYGRKDTKFRVEGQMLHAMTLGFIHPSQNEYVEFSSNLPDYFLDILNTLDKKENY